MRLSENEEAIDSYQLMPCWLIIGDASLSPQLLSIERTDLVHLHLPYIFGAELVYLRALSTGIPLVVTYHSDLLSTQTVRRSAFFIYNRLVMSPILNKAQRIAVTSFDYALSSFFGQSIFRRRWKDLVEVPNGVDVDFFRPGIDASGVAARHGLQRDDIVLLFVSSLAPSHARKGLDLLLEALAHTSADRLKLIVVGEGTMRPAYERQAREAGLNGQVIFAGRVAQEEISAYYSACDMVVIPSRPPEAFGVALAQGMAAGKPVIGSNIPGVRTVVKDGETGFLIEPGDKADLVRRIEQLVKDPDLRHRMGQNGRRRVTQEYTWQQAGQRLLNMYEEVLAED
jgi:glycosyltransferase involved in cell wall biosynthesis